MKWGEHLQKEVEAGTLGAQVVFLRVEPIYGDLCPTLFPTVLWWLQYCMETNGKLTRYMKRLLELSCHLTPMRQA